ncbi:hypothetical protein STRPS_1990 [Streptococcus pseudoporcinus LQ 940-04]|uniref:Uncharacterized protein n=1 Tax=Streptococcus pseudoporcinus LQ 940-04 TaxID=875093 RepID=G5KAM7_9STRE|nr:hypothetical protein HMPREF9320_0628 [Streptococcus pseudoporcinus SPIN 20026]EHI64792.1 hypothetical protein STRPS_1990 [Streptococcus pseudoporcinus LQ 940-04]
MLVFEAVLEESVQKSVAFLPMTKKRTDKISDNKISERKSNYLFPI